MIIKVMNHGDPNSGVLGVSFRKVFEILALESRMRGGVERIF
jgi:hypothetical protein